MSAAAVAELTPVVAARLATAPIGMWYSCNNSSSNTVHMVAAVAEVAVAE